MYNLSVNCATNFDLNAPTVCVLVTDEQAGTPITGLQDGQFALYYFVTAQGFKPVPAFAVSEANSQSLPGLYLMGSIDWALGGQASYAIAVTVTAAIPLIKRSPSQLIAPPEILGIGVGTYIKQS